MATNSTTNLLPSNKILKSYDDLMHHLDKEYSEDMEWSISEWHEMVQNGIDDLYAALGLDALGKGKLPSTKIIQASYDSMLDDLRGGKYY